MALSSKQIVRACVAGWLSTPVALCLLGLTLGCGLEAGPQPPSLYLPRTISDLTATRAGNQVRLEWKTPRETTDKLRLHGPVRLRICRAVDHGACQTAATIFAAADKPASYIDVLPAPLVTGAIRPIQYEIFGLNKHDRSSGPSNAAAVLAGEAPPMVRTLSASEVERGVVLHWLPVAGLAPEMFIEFERTLMTPVAETRKKSGGGLRPIAEPAEQTLRVELAAGETDPGHALDESVRFDRKYRYVATRVAVQQVGAQKLRLASSPSEAVVIATSDVFPPTAPTGLAAVPVSAAMNGGAAEVDLSWSANTEPDLAHYLIYRRVLGSGDSAPRQIGPEDSAESIVAPAFRDMHVQPGQRYLYSVVAVDTTGNKSVFSAEVEVTVPGG